MKRPYKFITTLLVSVLIIIFFSIHSSVYAEMVKFKGFFDGDVREECQDVSLSETISATEQGKVGPGCTFTVTIQPMGDWQSVGGWYDTPPYAWANSGTPFPSAYRGADFTMDDNKTFVCRSVQFSLGSLPAYIQASETTQANTDPFQAPKKIYTFTVAQNVGIGTSFNLTFGAQATCGLYYYYRVQNGNIRWAQPKQWGMPKPEDPNDASNCSDRPNIEINPRGNGWQTTLPYTANESCLPPPTLPPTLTPTPTPTPPPPPPNTPTPTPTPTATPIPTSTPTPTRTPTPTITPTPTPPASCDCEGLLEVISGTIGMGSTFTVRQHASTTSNAHVNSMVYHVERRINNGPWEEIANSGEITAVATTDDPNLYYTDWTYTIPVESTSGTYEYHIWVDLSNRCEYNAHAYNRYDSVVLGTSTQKGSFFEMIRSFIASLFGGFRGTSKQNGEIPFMGPAAPITGILRPTGVKSPQLGTFYPALNIIKACKEMWFTVFVP